MGMYDSIYLKVKCPYCGEVSEMEFQTKEGQCSMYTYRKGMIFERGQFRKIYAYGTCDSLICQFESAKEAVWIMGYYGGFSRSFDIIVYCDEKGKITGKIKITKLTSHKGIMKGKLGELKKKEDNMKVVKHVKFKKGKVIDAVMEKMTTDGWLDKFNEDSFDNGKQTYEAVLYLYNLEDSEKAMKIWFSFRYKLSKILEFLKKKLKIKEDEVLASVFLSNKIEDIYNLT